MGTTMTPQLPCPLRLPITPWRTQPWPHCSSIRPSISVLSANTTLHFIGLYRIQTYSHDLTTLEEAQTEVAFKTQPQHPWARNELAQMDLQEIYHMFLNTMIKSVRTFTPDQTNMSLNTMIKFVRTFTPDQTNMFLNTMIKFVRTFTLDQTTNKQFVRTFTPDQTNMS